MRLHTAWFVLVCVVAGCQEAPRENEAKRDVVADSPLRLADAPVRVAWQHPLGQGYSGVSVAGRDVVVAFADDGEDWVASLDISTGQERWRSRLEATYPGHDGSVDGPLSTPAVAQRAIFALSARGRLHALDRETGRRRWERNLAETDGSPVPYFGFATSPLVAAGRNPTKSTTPRPSWPVWEA